MSAIGSIVTSIKGAYCEERRRHATGYGYSVLAGQSADPARARPDGHGVRTHHPGCRALPGVRRHRAPAGALERGRRDQFVDRRERTASLTIVRANDLRATGVTVRWRGRLIFTLGRHVRQFPEIDPLVQHRAERTRLPMRALQFFRHHRPRALEQVRATVPSHNPSGFSAIKYALCHRRLARQITRRLPCQRRSSTGSRPNRSASHSRHGCGSTGQGIVPQRGRLFRINRSTSRSVMRAARA